MTVQTIINTHFVVILCENVYIITNNIFRFSLKPEQSCGVKNSKQAPIATIIHFPRTEEKVQIFAFNP